MRPASVAGPAAGPAAGRAPDDPTGSRDPGIDISVVIPVYNSQATIDALLQRLVAVLSTLTPRYEIVLVEDAGPDDAWGAIREAAPQYGDKVVAVQLMRNFGQHNALMCGLSVARGELIVTMDDDLQNPPEEIPKLVDSIRRSGLDLVYGVTPQRRHASWRNLGAAVVWRFYRTVFRTEITPTTFRIMRRDLAKGIAFYDLNFTYLDGLLAWCTSRIGTVPVEHHARQVGRSGYSLRKLLALALNLYTNFSLLPLQVVSAVGLLTAVSGFATGAFYLLQYLLQNIEVPGFASTIIAILILGGVQLVALGIFGEYLGRLHLNVNRKPQYVVRQIERFDGQHPDQEPLR